MNRTCIDPCKRFILAKKDNIQLTIDKFPHITVVKSTSEMEPNNSDNKERGDTVVSEVPKIGMSFADLQRNVNITN